MAMFSSGLVLAQHKEPAFSRPLVRFVNPQLDRQLIGGGPPADPDSLKPDEIIEIARAARIVDERDGKLLYRKLARAKGRAAAVVGDAVDDEPYVSSQINPLLKFRREAAGGLELCRRVAGAEKAFFMAYKVTLGMETRLPRQVEDFRVIRLRGGYPAEAHAGMLQPGAGRRLIVGTGALIHLYRAVHTGKVQTTAFVTVAGNCIAFPTNVEASLGMTVDLVLERCGLMETPTRVVVGGSMTGLSITEPGQTQVQRTTRALLAFQERERDFYYSCIGCGRCEQVCPMGLNPMYIHRFVENSFFASLRRFDAHLCTGCGTCSYVCPSRLDVSLSVVRAKQYAIDHYIETGEGDEDED